MKRINTQRLVGLLSITLLLGFIMPSCKKSDNDKPKTIYQTIASDPQYSILAAAVNKAGLAQALNDASKSGLTLFAPTNDAFKTSGFTSLADLDNIPAGQLAQILLYHVVDGKVLAAQIPQASNTPVVTLNTASIFATRTNDGKVFINGVSVTKADIICTNGVIHNISRVLIPAAGTIVETAVGNPNLSLLVAAVLRASQGATNVATVLSGAGPFTVFAPTNQAFITAGFADEAAINAADPDVLTSILTYHVIAGRIFSSDLTDGATPATVNGGNVTISLSPAAQVKGNGNATASNIVATDIVTTNGVVHVIDQVLLP